MVLEKESGYFWGNFVNSIFLFSLWLPLILELVFHFELEIKNNNQCVIKTSSIALLLRLYLFHHNVYCLSFSKTMRGLPPQAFFQLLERIKQRSLEWTFSLCSPKPGNLVEGQGICYIKWIEIMHLFKNLSAVNKVCIRDGLRLTVSCFFKLYHANVLRCCKKYSTNWFLPYLLKWINWEHFGKEKTHQ